MSGVSPFQPTFLGRLGPWRVLRRLGRGGAAVVYEVLQPETGQRAALKLLNDPTASDRVVRREYRALALLDHPAIVRVHGCGRLQGGPPWMLMELVVGSSSQASVQRAGPTGSPARGACAMRIAHDLLEALAYLHRRRILHRDVKSSNVLATTEGGVKLLDLGAAGYAPAAGGSGPVRVPAGGAFAGTVVYASPEQLCGASLDARTDLFSVGVLWYRMLTGELPFPPTERVAAVAARIAGPSMERLREAAGPSPEVAGLIASLLQFEPAGRPDGAATALERLRPLLDQAATPTTALWPEPPPLCGRAVLLESLDGFVAGAPGWLAVLEAGPGQEEGALIGWIAGTVRRGGGVAVGVDLADGQGGGLLSRLLLALPRHLRRGLGVQGSPREAAGRALERLARGRAISILVTICGLERAGEADLLDLQSLLAAGTARGLALGAVGLVRTGMAPTPPSWPAGTSCLALPPMEPAATLHHVRAMCAHRVLPCAIEAALLREERLPLGGFERWARERIADGRLALSSSPEGVPVWIEGSAEPDEGPPPAGPALGRHLAAAPGSVPWEGPPVGTTEPLSGLLAADPEEIPEPRARAALYAWRGLARQLAGDRDLQAEADLLRAWEELRGATAWEDAPTWHGRLALGRVAGRLARGWVDDARRLCVGLDSAAPGDRWPLGVAALRVDMARLAGEPVVGRARPGTASALALAWLQEGRLRAVARCVRGAAQPAPGGWGAADRAALVVAVAGALRLRGALAGARALLQDALAAAEVAVPGPVRVRLLLALAELDLDLFTPGLARERLADAWVLLRPCDRPELAAERARLLARAALLRGEIGRAEEAARGGLELLRGTDLTLARAGLSCWLARALGRLGRRAEAESLLGTAIACIEAAGAQPALSLACLVRWELAGPGGDPRVARLPVDAWLAAERARLVRFEWQLAALRHAHAVGDPAARAALRRQARTLLRTLQRGLSPDDCATMDQSPALRVLGVR